MNKKIPSDATSGREAYKNASFHKIISKLYLALDNVKGDHILYIKER